MQARQLIAVLVAFIVILGAALFVVTWTGEDDDDTAATTTTSTSSTTTSSTTTTSTTTTTTSIPVGCTFADGTVTTTLAEGEEPDPGDQPVPTVPDGSGLNTNSSVTTVGLDEVNFGMTVKQAEEAANTPLIPCEPVGECYRVTPGDAPEGISFLVTAGTIERVDIVAGPITTRSGVGIGTTQERIIELFGDQIETEVNDDSSVDLIFVPSDEGDAQFRVVFTVVDGTVETFRSGRVPQVLDDEPCTA